MCSDSFSFPAVSRPSRTGKIEVLADEYGKKVFREYFEKPAGGEYGWLLMESACDSVMLFPLDENGRVIALATYRYGADDVLWELPGGGIKHGQTAVEAARDELSEEAGYSAGSIVALGAESAPTGGFWFDPATMRARFLPFLAIDCTKDDAVHESELGEHVAPQMFSIGDWYRGLILGKVNDCKSIAVSFLALPSLDPTLRQEALAVLQSH
jgi:ADP-ribose pyrophosphatase